MIQNCKICGVKDSQTLKYITNHMYPPKMIGFICNWPKSKRFVSDDQLKELLKIDKKGTSYVAVLVNPDDDINIDLSSNILSWHYYDPNCLWFVIYCCFSFIWFDAICRCGSFLSSLIKSF